MKCARHRRHRHERPADQCRGHRQQHRQHQHHRLQAGARGVHRPVLSDRTACRAFPNRAALRPCRKAPISASASSTAGGAQVAHPGRAVADRQHATTWRSTGAGWFQIAAPNNDMLYTRAGSFNTNANGQLVTLDGYRSIPRSRCRRERSRSSSTRPARSSRSSTRKRPSCRIGQLNSRQLRQRGGPRAARRQSLSGDDGVRPAVVGVPGDPGYGKIDQGYLEAPNVDPVKEITELISAQRAYEMNSKVITASDEMASTVSKGLR